jgi:hypothetical protein
MIIGVAGPYSATTEEQRQANLDALNAAAAHLLAMGHVPLIGVNAALPVVAKAQPPDPYEAIMAISMAVIERCDALLLIAESPGALREAERMRSLGRPVFTSLSEIPTHLK